MLVCENRLVRKVTSISILLIMFVQLNSCARTDREEEVYQLIKHGVELAEGHDLGGLMDLTQDGFIADPGKRSRKEVRRVLFVTFKRFGKFRIHFPRPSIRVSEDGESAKAQMNFLIASKGELFPELELLYEDAVAWVEAVDKQADLYSLSMNLEYESGSWLVKKVRISGFSRPIGRL